MLSPIQCFFFLCPPSVVEKLKSHRPQMTTKRDVHGEATCVTYKYYVFQQLCPHVVRLIYMKTMHTTYIFHHDAVNLLHMDRNPLKSRPALHLP